MTLAVVAMMSLATATTGARDVKGFTRYAHCSPDGVHRTEPTRLCQEGDTIVAVLRYGEPVDYKVCVTFGAGRTSCGPTRHLIPGTSSIENVDTQGFVGRVTLSWRVASIGEVGRYEMRIVGDPIVPTFGLSPLIVSGTHRIFGLIVRHVTPGLQVRAWRQCRGSCRLHLRLVSSRGETRRYRVRRSRNSIFSFGDLLYVQVDAPGRRLGNARLWGRLYTGKLVRDPGGGPNDTAVHRIGSILCTPPGALFRRAINCIRVRR